MGHKVNTKRKAYNPYKDLYKSGHKKKKHKKNKKHSELLKVRTLLSGAPALKKKCCRSCPRCSTCPAVLRYLQKNNALTLDDAALQSMLLEARLR
ncbi:hypothetical protein [Corynebacterium sp. sy039]|uniref:hypothetical protein n=1 Tax=Corynebacterium sp. sy039 TaxID=2599641 RepID=UPI0011B6D855|nr:hypothetical protein [Corynebacterium sp. sy039]QDZ42267.1 hypothetical protein FQV43_03110 [Corynebacterium sp. sy039]